MCAIAQGGGWGMLLLHCCFCCYTVFELDKTLCLRLQREMPMRACNI